ncbi:MAG: hypothetical protein HY698_14470 [Deltaproteobacteria bacterium]|nr:hypothetical protein [Deltaproteobacteria bacterium]
MRFHCPAEVPNAGSPAVALSGRFPRACIQGTEAHSDLENKLFAVNLLDIRVGLFYQLYGLFAFAMLRRVGGRLLCMLPVQGHLGGQPLPVSTVLVVQYPNAEAFIRMASRPAFSAASILRVAALRHFRFGFTERRDAGREPQARPRPFRGPSSFAIHLLPCGLGRGHEAQADGLVDLAEVQRVAHLVGASVFFAGHTAARVASQHGPNEPPRGVSIAPELGYKSVLVLEAQDAKALHELLESEAYAQATRTGHGDWAVPGDTLLSARRAL